MTIAKGRRSSTATAYLPRRSSARNLTVLTNAMAKRIVMEGRRATGIVLDHDGTEKKRSPAGREVLLSGGVIKHAAASHALGYRSRR